MNFSKVFVTALVLFMSTTLTFAQTDLLTWEGSDENVVRFLNSSNEKNHEFALQKIIMNPKILNSNATEYEIYHMYRSHPNDRIRQMALVALYRLENYQLLKNLADDFYKEKNPKIRQQILCILEEMPVLSKIN